MDTSGQLMSDPFAQRLPSSVDEFLRVYLKGPLNYGTFDMLNLRSVAIPTKEHSVFGWWPLWQEVGVLRATQMCQTDVPKESTQSTSCVSACLSYPEPQVVPLVWSPGSGCPFLPDSMVDHG